MAPRRASTLTATCASAPGEPDVDAAVAERQLAQRHVVDEVGQHRLVEDHVVVLRIEADPEAGAQQRERRGGRPGLRRAGDRVEGRAVAAQRAGSRRRARAGA